jgi:lambda family phage minor tail protein L|tara:strand:+ start:5693 stop:6835 length:1143 start_codon:yes stop_codon:yes gene_type:complete
MSDIIATDVQGHYVDSSLVTLFEIEIDGAYAYFHAGLDEDLDNVQFLDRDGSAMRTYLALPILVDGMEIAADGAQSRPTLTLANVTTVFKDALGGFTNEDLIGKKLVRRQTFRKFLKDGSQENLVTNPITIPTEFPIREYIIDRISSENKVSISFELASPFDLEGITLPRRVIVGKYCSWVYQGMGLDTPVGACSWKNNGQITIQDSGTYTAHQFYFTEDDVPLVASTTSAPNWSASTTYTPTNYITYETKVYVSKTSNNINNVPSVEKDQWQEVYLYTTYSNSETGYVKGDYVRYGIDTANETIWRYIAPTTNVASPAPVARSIYWARADVCGKEISSCKCRFQALPISITTSGQPPAGDKNTNRVLPFGAYPGSAKYK